MAYYVNMPLLFLLLGALMSDVTGILSRDTRKLTAYPLLLTHDSATGEIDTSRDGIIKDIIDAYSITQSKGLIDQLTCGARGFDYRPYLLSNGSLIAHHGSTKVKKLMSDSISELKDWIQNNEEEMIVLYLSHFDGDDEYDDYVEGASKSATIKLLQRENIKYITDCNLLTSISVMDTYKLGQLNSNSGAIIGIINCVNENYVSSINCYDWDYTCYGHNSDIPWNQLKNYTFNSTDAYHSESLYMTQVHWQSDSTSVTLGNLHLSSVIEDEQKSGVNQWLLEQINSKALKYINILEIDNVCNFGLDIYNSLNENYN